MAAARGRAPEWFSILGEFVDIRELEVRRIVVPPLVVEEEHQRSVPFVVYDVEADVQLLSDTNRLREKGCGEVDLTLYLQCLV